MGGDHRVRSIVLLRASGCAQSCADAWSGDVGDVRGHHWCVARDGGECAGIFGSGLDDVSKASRCARVSRARVQLRLLAADQNCTVVDGNPPSPPKTTDGYEAIWRPGAYRKGSLRGLDA